MKSILTQEFHEFFIELASNNNKEWFDLNRKRYENHVKNPFKQLVEALIDRFGSIDLAFKDVEAKDCIFRINRDIRFSKDKTPYKIQASAVIASGGKKSRSLDGIYLEITPEHVRVYGGIYELDTEGLHAIREGISTNLSEFKELYTAPKFKSVFGEIRGDKNKVLPKELRMAAENEPLLYNKQWYFFTEWDPEVALEQDFTDRVVDVYKIARPIEQFFQKFVN